MQITLHDETHRRRAHALIDAAPLLSRVTVADPKRSDAQNRRLWAMIGDVMKQRPDWFGPNLNADDIKQIFMASLFRELRMAKNVDGDGYVPLVRRSSRLSVREMADLITLIDAWGAREGVVWSEFPPTPESYAETGEAEKDEEIPVSPSDAPFDPGEWAVAYNRSLAEWFDAEALKADWEENFAKRKTLAAMSPRTAAALKNEVMARIGELSK